MDSKVPSDPRTSTIPFASATRMLPGENPLADATGAARSKSNSARPKTLALYDPDLARTIICNQFPTLHSCCQRTALLQEKTGQNRSEVLNKARYRRPDEDFPATRAHDSDVWHHLCPVDQGSTASDAEDTRWKAEFIRAGATSA